jgi:hypothetical protein
LLQCVDMKYDNSQIEAMSNRSYAQPKWVAIIATLRNAAGSTRDVTFSIEKKSYHYPVVYVTVSPDIPPVDFLMWTNPLSASRIVRALASRAYSVFLKCAFVGNNSFADGIDSLGYHEDFVTNNATPTPEYWSSDDDSSDESSSCDE